MTQSETEILADAQEDNLAFEMSFFEQHRASFAWLPRVSDRTNQLCIQLTAGFDTPESRGFRLLSSAWKCANASESFRHKQAGGLLDTLAKRVSQGGI